MTCPHLICCMKNTRVQFMHTSTECSPETRLWPMTYSSRHGSRSSPASKNTVTKKDSCIGQCEFRITSQSITSENTRTKSYMISLKTRKSAQVSTINSGTILTEKNFRTKSKNASASFPSNRRMFSASDRMNFPSRKYRKSINAPSTLRLEECSTRSEIFRTAFPDGGGYKTI